MSTRKSNKGNFMLIPVGIVALLLILGVALYAVRKVNRAPMMQKGIGTPSGYSGGVAVDDDPTAQDTQNKLDALDRDSLAIDAGLAENPVDLTQ